MSAFVAIVNAIAEALTAAPAVASGRVYVNRLQPIPGNVTSAVDVRLLRSSAMDGMPLGQLYWSTQVSVECYARAAAGADPADSVDALLAAVWARLAALDASAIGAYDVTISPDIEWQFVELDTPLICAVLRLTVQHYTTTTALSV